MPLDGEYEPGTDPYARRQAERYEMSGGRERADIGGRPIIVLTSIGARTGRLRKTALMRVEHGGRYLAVASLGGAARDPAWVANLRHDARAMLQDGETTRDYLARELEGDEREAWWARAVAAFPRYEGYQRRTRRRIPIFLLEPLQDGMD